MKIFIFGSTGTIGKQLVKQALNKGYKVTVFAWNIEKLEEIIHENLQKYKGDVMDPASVSEAIKGHDAVFVLLVPEEKVWYAQQGL